MAFDFPSAPTLNQNYQNYFWDGEKWTTKVPPGAPLGVPPGGTVNQIIAKNSSATNDTSWTSTPNFLNTTVQDITAYRRGAPSEGVIFFGDSGGKYIYYASTYFVTTGAWWFAGNNVTGISYLQHGCGTFAELQAEIAAGRKLITIARDASISVIANLTIPAGRVLRVEPGAQFVISTGVTLEIRCAVEAAPRQFIFNCVGTGVVRSIRDVWVDWFGALGNYDVNSNTGTDDYAAIKMAFDCVSTSLYSDGGEQIVRFAGADYLVGQPVVVVVNHYFSVRIKGAGVMIEGTRLYAKSAGFVNPTAAVLVIYAALSAPTVDIKIEDISFFTPWVGGVPTTNCTCALQLGWADVNYAINGLSFGVTLRNVHFDNYEVGLRVFNVRQINMRDCSIWMQAKAGAPVGLWIEGTAGMTAGDSVFENVQIVGNRHANPPSTPSGASICVKLRAAGSGSITGLRFDKCIFQHSLDTIYFDMTSNGGISDMWVMSCHFDGVYRGPYLLIPVGNGNSFIFDFHLKDNYWQGVEGPGVSLSANSGIVKDLLIQGNRFTSCTGRAVEFYRAANVIVSDNIIRDSAAGVSAILAHTSVGVIIADNLGQKSSADIYSLTPGTPVLEKLIELNGVCDDILVHGNHKGHLATNVVHNITGLVAPQIQLADNF